MSKEYYLQAQRRTRERDLVRAVRQAREDIATLTLARDSRALAEAAICKLRKLRGSW